MTNGKRDYKKELNWEKTAAKHRAADRVQRVLARREVEKDTGNLPRSIQIDHVKAIQDGGTNARSNLKPISAKANLHKEAMRKRK